MSEDGARPQAPEWPEILQEPYVVLILGSRGSGKTALGHRLLEVFAGPDQERDAYIMGFPATEEDTLPDWIDTLPANIPMSEWPEESLVLLHEAHHIMHARQSMNVENLEIDRLVTVSRHRDTCIITETQQSQRLDRNAVTAVDGVIIREPALLQADFERKQVRTIIKDAEETLGKYITTYEADDGSWTFRKKSDEIQKHAYIYSERFVGEYPHEIELADHWTESISTVFSTVNAEGEQEPQLDQREMQALEDLAEWERENRPLAFEHKGAEHHDVALQRAWNTLTALVSKGFVEKTYSSNSSTYYRLTDDGRDLIGYDPDVPLLKEDE